MPSPTCSHCPPLQMQISKRMLKRIAPCGPCFIHFVSGWRLHNLCYFLQLTASISCILVSLDRILLIYLVVFRLLLVQFQSMRACSQQCLDRLKLNCFNVSIMGRPIIPTCFVNFNLFFQNTSVKRISRQAKTLSPVLQVFVSMSTCRMSLCCSAFDHIVYSVK